MSTCPSCGASLESGALFCPSCRQTVPQEPVEAAVFVPPSEPAWPMVAESVASSPPPPAPEWIPPALNGRAIHCPRCNTLLSTRAVVCPACLGPVVPRPAAAGGSAPPA
ncbi:MAG: zinc ribbon domain-containing protein [Thermoplasmata archaeon]|nr:zinc ribbon domain-containing protein [Thermoplasmata archaeon]